MSDQIPRQSEEEFQYPDAFKHAIAEVFGNIPRIAKNVESYQIKMESHAQSEKMQISFHVPESVDNKQENINAVSNFLSFVVNTEMDGVIYDYETGSLTFNNAGLMEQMIECYIDENPDDISDDSIEYLEDMLTNAIQSNAQELLGESAAQSVAAQSLYPRSSIAFIDAIATIKSKFEGGEDLSHYYMENPDNGMISMMIACENMDGADFVDPDHIDTLAEIESVIGAYNSNIPVKIQMHETNTRLMIHADNPMAMLNFIRECYKQIGIAGGEDVYEQYDPISTAQNNYGVKLSNELMGENGEGKDIVSRRNKRAISQHFGRHCLSYGQNVSKLNPDKELHLIPMQVYNSIQSVRIAQGLSLEAGVSIRSIEARVLQELGHSLPSVGRPFTYH